MELSGLTAAHELMERGFSVIVYERRKVPGGKARSMGDPHTGTGGRKDLPGEHGFRFFPGFYKHLPDTMKRIPYGSHPQGVFDNLVPATRFLLAHQGNDPTFVARFPTSLQELYELLKDIFTANLGIPDSELLYFASRILCLLTSCQDRRLAEYEKIPWWTFVGASTRSQAYQQYLAEGLTRSLVAMKAEIGSTHTVGDILIQLLISATTPGEAMDRVLIGPTSDVWITVWREYLAQRGVGFRFTHEVVGLDCQQGRLVGASVKDRLTGQVQQVQADYFVAALPVEIITPLVTPAMAQADPRLGELVNLQVRWMTGIQFYLRDDVPLVHGHAIYVDTPWALTSISQAQFWKTPLTQYGDGTTHGVLSVDVSDWTTPGILYNKPAMDLGRDEIKNEVWAQLRRSLDVDPDAVKLVDSNLTGWHLDPDIEFPSPHHDVNLEPLMVNVADSWRYRPEAVTRIPNLFLASDYVRTYTDLATMEGANEAARRAVNGILDACGSTAPRCRLWAFEEPLVFAPARAADEVLFKLGLPHPC